MTIRMFAVVLIACVLMMPPTSAQTSATQSEERCVGINVLTPSEQAAGWRLLFDGKSKTGWHGYNNQDTQAWAIQDCALKTAGTETNYGSPAR